MAEVIGEAQQPVTEAGTYACSLCGHRIELKQGETFPAYHHDEHPWTLMLRSGV